MERLVVIPVVIKIDTDFLGLFQTPERTLTRHTTEPNAPLLIYFARKDKKTNEQKRTAPFLRTSNGRIDRGPSTQTEGTVSPNTDRPRPVNNIFIFFLLRFKSFRKILLQPPTYVCWRRARSCWCYSKRAIDCKPKQNITTWFLTCNLYYHN